MKTENGGATACRKFMSGLLLLLLVTNGCAAKKLLVQDPITGPSFKPTNVDRRNLKLTPDIRRVAVLPVVADAEAQDGVDTLASVLRAELGRTRLFEAVEVSAARLERLTGKGSWSAEDRLPVKFFELLREEVGCDAVLFARLTQFRPYPPVAVGWRLKLVSASEPVTIWSVDEVLDARDASVANGARRYQLASRPAFQDSDSRSILLSPKEFGHYATSTLLATLPDR